MNQVHHTQMTIAESSNKEMDTLLKKMDEKKIDWAQLPVKQKITLLKKRVKDL
ncbi:MAG: hypothetical protein GXP56_14285 [Deltaproteobacteria bacterium]|nr:hypothetical protein [Deltaproteobacteria bacterium]